MTAFDVLQGLADAGIDVYRDGDSLRYRAPVGAYTPALRELVACHRAALLGHLDATARLTPAACPPAWRETWEERAAILEFDAGFGRAEAERRALEQIARTMPPGLLATYTHPFVGAVLAVLGGRVDEVRAPEDSPGLGDASMPPPTTTEAPR